MYSTLRYTLESNGTTYENDNINASLLVELISNLELHEYVVLKPSELVEEVCICRLLRLRNQGKWWRRFVCRKARTVSCITATAQQIQLGLFNGFWITGEATVATARVLAGYHA
ncbi:hypothetical protein MT997_11280 [Paenibacillus sp. OVF10]|nr:hypothetical protein MT997_11280 [Paenibacillus sp. OVF10]